MRALVTGASGFIGANLVRHLLREGHEVHVMLRNPDPNWRLSGVVSSLNVHWGDVSDAESTSSCFAAANPDWIFHLAAYGAYPDQDDLAQAIATNVAGTANVLEAAVKHGCQALVNAGTSSEYGYKSHAPVEDEVLEPNSNYAVAKAAAGMLCRFIGQSRQAPVVSLRLYSVFGPYEDPSRFIPTLLVRGFGGGFPPLVDPAVARDFVYVGDVVKAFVLAAEQARDRPGSVFNIGTGIQTTIGDAVALAKNLLGIPAEPEWGSYARRRWDTNVWVSDSRRAAAQLGWVPGLDFRAGLEATIDWLRQDASLLKLYEARPSPR